MLEIMFLTIVPSLRNVPENIIGKLSKKIKEISIAVEIIIIMFPSCSYYSKGNNKKYALGTNAQVTCFSIELGRQ